LGWVSIKSGPWSETSWEARRKSWVHPSAGCPPI